jgi:hypothetical protein
MASKWLDRLSDAPFPYQEWRPFPYDAIVQVRSAFYPDVPDAIGPAGSFWWGYEREMGGIGEGVIIKCRRLDRSKGIR